MKIAIEADTIHRHGSGSAKVGRRLVEHLLELAPSLEITLFHRASTGNVSDDPLYRRCREMIVPDVPTRRMAEGAAYSWFNFKARTDFDIVHYPRPLVYPFFWRIGRKCVVHIHDAGGMTLPQMHDDVGPLGPRASPLKRFSNWALRHSSDRIDAVIMGTRWPQHDVTECYGIPAERIHVAPYAADPIFRPLPDRALVAEDVRRRYGIPGPFVLCMGRLQPHKNIRGMLRAWAAVNPGVRANVTLVLLGRRQWRYQDIYDLADELKLRDQIMFVDRDLPEDDVVKFLNAAEVFVFPSLFEGFGLPLVEAMACGAPCVSSNRTCLPEVAGDAAVLIDPLNPVEFAAAIERVLSDEALRSSLSARGIQRASAFSWRQHADDVLAVYRELA